MNREIKFRAWDGEAMRYPGHFGLHGYLSSADILGRYETVMQYTGLKDKNGKPIYEGDIVRYKEFERFREGESVHVSVVKYYCEPNSRVGFEPMVWHTKVEDGYYNSELEDYEVIGNIYENPELLEGK